jgi:putative Mg2+ transporter-C (MgtC) family protein
MDTLDIALRLFAATAAGAMFGLNRDMHDKQTGVRTLGLVGLGAALAVMAAARIGGEGDVSRAIQGIVTGIGFLGAGVIVRPASGSRIHGLTTAACTWLTACVGAACAVAEWRAVVIGLALAFIVLIFGGPFEKWVRQRWQSPSDDGTG